MSHFYSRIQGGRGAATRCGHTHIGGTISSWTHKVHVSMFRTNDDDIITVTVDTPNGTVALWEGPSRNLTTAAQLLR